MAKLTYHVLPAPRGGWSVKKGGSERALKHFTTQQGAVTYGKSVSQNRGTLFIHKPDGTIHEMLSYGRDRFPPSSQK